MPLLRTCIQQAGHLSKARILLADDHPGLLEVVEQHLEPEFDGVGKVVDGQALFEEAIRLKPYVIDSDISMPILNGMESVNQLKESLCKSRVVFLTVHADPDFASTCIAPVGGRNQRDQLRRVRFLS